MGMTLKEVYNHYNRLDPLRQISKNSADSTITTVTYSQFKTICGLTQVYMAEFKKKMFASFRPIAEVVGNNNIAVRLGLKKDYFEVYDVMLIKLDQEKINKIVEIMRSEGLFEYGFKAMILYFVYPKKEDGEEGEKLTTCMFRFVPPTEKANEFFGYIL